MHSYIIPLNQQFKQYADKLVAAGARAYLRNQFEYFGIKTPLRRQLCKDYMKKELPPYEQLSTLVRELWELPEREFQYFATELMAACKKQWKKNIITLMEYMIIHKSWWDSVDHIASELTGPYFNIYPEQASLVTGRWNRSDNIWLQRSSLMFQKAYRRKTDTKLLATYILQLKSSREFFVQKAIGWALREYSKTDPGWVKQFVKQQELAPLSKREALKRLRVK